MPTYVYETVPKDAQQKPRRFEISQRMSDPALAKDPKTGEKIRRVISGGLGFIGATDRKSAASPPMAHQCDPGCAH